MSSSSFRAPYSAPRTITWTCGPSGGTRSQTVLVLLALLATVVFAMVTIAPAQAEEESVSIDGITYSAQRFSSDTARVSGFTGTSKRIQLKSSVEINKRTYTVTAIGYGAFLNKGLESVTIPNSVTTIENWAFFGNLIKRVDIPDSVTTIGILAFGFNQLTSVRLPRSLKAIRLDAFSNNKLTEVEIPGSVTTIGPNAFAHNPLASVVFRGPAPSVDPTAFGGGVRMSYLPRYDASKVGPDGFTTPTWKGHQAYPDTQPGDGVPSVSDENRDSSSAKDQHTKEIIRWTVGVIAVVVGLPGIALVAIKQFASELLNDLPFAFPS